MDLINNLLRHFRYIDSCRNRRVCKTWRDRIDKLNINLRPTLNIFRVYKYYSMRGGSNIETRVCVYIPHKGGFVQAHNVALRHEHAVALINDLNKQEFNPKALKSHFETATSIRGTKERYTAINFWDMNQYIDYIYRYRHDLIRKIVEEKIITIAEINSFDDPPPQINLQTWFISGCILLMAITFGIIFECTMTYY